MLPIPTNKKEYQEQKTKRVPRDNRRKSNWIISNLKFLNMNLASTV